VWVSTQSACSSMDNVYFIPANPTLFPVSGVCCLTQLSSHMWHWQVRLLVKIIVQCTQASDFFVGESVALSCRVALRTMFKYGGFINWKFLCLLLCLWDAILHVFLNFGVDCCEVVNYIRCFKYLLYCLSGTRGSLEVKALDYKPGGRGFETWWGEILMYLILSAALGPGVLLSL
jgi:hypothetical protein